MAAGLVSPLVDAADQTDPSRDPRPAPLVVAASLAVVGVIENVNIRAGKKYKPRPRS